jgi:Zn ribbon nucleic-acid-binding protein
MSVYRARTNCPICNNEEEVWFQNGKIEPLDVVECPKCEHMFEPKDFVSTFLEMKNNATISTSYVSL